jgi:hypothetical protein
MRQKLLKEAEKYSDALKALADLYEEKFGQQTDAQSPLSLVFSRCLRLCTVITCR